MANEYATLKLRVVEDLAAKNFRITASLVCEMRKELEISWVLVEMFASREEAETAIPALASRIVEQLKTV